MTSILVLNGSPRGAEGNTAIVTEAFLRGIAEAGNGIEVKKHYLNKMQIASCIGCYGCWNKTPGRCVFNDDMEQLLADYIASDVIIFATPLYHYGMTALLKKAIERTLPLNMPYMVKKGDHYSHPARYPGKEPRHVLISNCGFPERHNFDSMVEHFQALTERKLDAAILCTGGEILRIKGANDVCKPYLGFVEKAGSEFALKGIVSPATSDELAKNFVEVEAFVDIANSFWNVPGENPPSPDVVHGHSASGANDDAANGGSTAQSPSMAAYMKGMAGTFRPEAAMGMKCTLQMDFTDSGEAYYFDIENGTCALHEGRTEHPTTTIRTTAELWLDIGNGKVSGSAALMEGKYRVLGDFGIMMKFTELFGSGSTEAPADTKKERGFLKFVPPMLWLSVLSFLPWYVFWIGGTTGGFSALIPLGFSLAFFAYRKLFIEITPFDIGNVVLFAIFPLWWLLDPSGYAQDANIIGSIALAVIWGASLMTKTPITAWYSKSSYPAGISSSALFIRINQILTVFWVLIYLFQAVVQILAPELTGMRRIGLIYGVLVVAGVFTSRFPKLYLERLGKAKS